MLANKLLIKVLEPAFADTFVATVFGIACWGEEITFCCGKTWTGDFSGVVVTVLGAEDSWVFKMELKVVFGGSLHETGVEGVDVVDTEKKN